ncbi:MAG: glycosyltransferase family 4 protein [Lachnospiraceae bacterium]|nr:glycosyltransferase family 4 protein [Lachnospiraceae bacterium]
MKILIINMYYYPNMTGGAEHSVKLLAEGLAHKKNEVSVYTLDSKSSSDALKCENINGVTIYRGFSKAIYERRLKEPQGSKGYSVMNGMSSLVNPKSQKDIKRLIEKIHPDVIHTNNPVSISYGVWKLAHEKGIKVVHTLRDYWLLDPTTVVGRTNRFLTYLFRMHFRRLSNKYVDVVTAPSAFVLNTFEKERYFQNSKRNVVPNSINLNYKLFQEVVDTKTKRNSEKISYLFAGYLADTKGVKELVNAFRKIDNDNIKLVICGDGPLMRFVKHNASEDQRIITKGKLSSKEMEREYSDADVMVVPSVWDEPFGRIVIEAAQYGLPTIGSNRGGIPEIIDTLGYGVYCDPQSDELTEELCAFSDRNRVKREMKKMGCSIKDFDLEHQIDIFSQIYRG